MFNNKSSLFLQNSSEYNILSIIGEFASLNQVGDFSIFHMWLSQTKISIWGNSPYVENYNGGQSSFVGTKTNCVSTIHSNIKISIIG